MEPNPYASPTARAAFHPGDAASDDPNHLLVIARQTFLAWEVLRLVYVATLTVVTLAALLRFAPHDLLNRGLLIVVFEGAVVANLAYFAGPIIETYVRWLGYRRTWPRWVLFLGGTLLAALLAFIVVSMETLPETN